MVVKLNISSVPLVNYFNSPAQGGVYWKIFDKHIQQFLTVRDLSAFFGTCKVIGRHRYAYSFRASFIESRCSLEKLVALARDLHNGFFADADPRVDYRLKNYLPHKDKYLNAEPIVYRLAKCLPPEERIFLKKFRAPYFPSDEQFDKMSEKEQEAYRQEGDHFGTQWEDYYKQPPELPITEKSPLEEEDELIISIDVDDTPAKPMAPKLEPKKAPNPEPTDFTLNDSYSDELDALSDPNFSALESGEEPHVYIALVDEPQVDRPSNCCRRALELLCSLAGRLCCHKR